MARLKQFSPYIAEPLYDLSLLGATLGGVSYYPVPFGVRGMITAKGFVLPETNRPVRNAAVNALLSQLAHGMDCVLALGTDALPATTRKTMAYLDDKNAPLERMMLHISDAIAAPGCLFATKTLPFEDSNVSHEARAKNLEAAVSDARTLRTKAARDWAATNGGIVVFNKLPRLQVSNYDKFVANVIKNDLTMNGTLLYAQESEHRYNYPRREKPKSAYGQMRRGNKVYLVRGYRHFDAEFVRHLDGSSAFHKVFDTAFNGARCRLNGREFDANVFLGRPEWMTGLETLKPGDAIRIACRQITEIGAPTRVGVIGVA